MRKPITMRFDLDLLSQARLQAARENRTLTNFIETVVRQRMSDVSLVDGPSDATAGKPAITPGSAAGQDR